MKGRQQLIVRVTYRETLRNMNYVLVILSACSIIATANGACTVPKVVDFESCLWNQNLAVSSGYDWKVTASLEVGASWSRLQALSIPFTGFQGSGVDHTFGTAEGNFLVVRRSRHLPTTAPYSAIESTEYVIDMHPCFVSFFYRLVGLSPDHLRVSFVSGGTVVHTANITVMATEWTKHTIQVPTTISTFKVRFEAILLPNQFDVGYIGLDDVRFSSTCCNEFRVPLRADFECGLQDYIINSGNDSLGRWNWSLARPGISPSRPSYDNTLGHIQPGHFLFVDALGYAGKFCEFHSPKLPPTLRGTSECFVSFWYIFGGGTLRLYQEDTSQSNRQLIWDSNKVAATSVWVRGFANLTSAADFHVLFQGYQSTPSGLELSIDDIEFSPLCWTRYSAPAVDYGLPGCEWIGYDTRSQSVSWDRAESVLAKDLIFPCNGTVLSVSAYVSGPCIYNFYVAAELPSVPFSPLATYFRVKGLATQVVFVDRSGMQTVSVSGMSFNQGDTILFEKDRSRSLPGSIRSSSYTIGSFCSPKFPIATLISPYPVTGVNAVKIEQSRCRFANQYAIRLNIMTNNPPPSTTANPAAKSAPTTSPMITDSGISTATMAGFTENPSPTVSPATTSPALTNSMITNNGLSTATMAGFTVNPSPTASPAITSLPSTNPMITDDGFSAAAVAGLTSGYGILVIASVVFIVKYMQRRKSKKAKEHKSDDQRSWTTPTTVNEDETTTVPSLTVNDAYGIQDISRTTHKPLTESEAYSLHGVPNQPNYDFILPHNDDYMTMS